MDRNLSAAEPGSEPVESPSTRRAWIEIPLLADDHVFKVLSPSTRRAWIEIAILKVGLKPSLQSPSTRRAWIEILCPIALTIRVFVALHPEGVDRNHKAHGITVAKSVVALHPEGVDRNRPCLIREVYRAGSPSTRRAWIEIFLDAHREISQQSPSTRRAWIEIRKESSSLRCNWRSPSTRRAWIEIEGGSCPLP